MKTLLLTFWQFPQILLGGLMRLWYRKRTTDTVRFWGVDYIIVPDMKGGGLSLGNSIFVKNGIVMNYNLWRHEWGHTRQSLYLGWFYLPVIGIPSLIWAAIWKKDYGPYYNFWTEKWADRLGGVER